jgi:superfamily II DNA/RNA helicase
MEAWFARRNWTIFPFQRETWRLMAEGQSGLLHATTGSGETLAVAFGAWLALSEAADADDAIRVLWITPMRALAADTALVRLNGPGRDSLRTPCFVMGERQIVPPAFGEFVGGSLVTPGEGERALIATARGACST